MKKILFIALLSALFVMCKTTKTTTAAATSTTAGQPEVAYRDNFKTVTDAEKAATLKELKATGENHSVLILTKNFKGENITVSNGSKKFYTGYPISNLGTGLAEKVAIDNTADITVYDSRSKKEAVLKSSDTKKYKFVYVSKKPGAKNPFVVTYSNKLAAFKGK
jgi:predicted SPOUT superfamily RNA methylase MTH1